MERQILIRLIFMQKITMKKWMNIKHATPEMAMILSGLNQFID
jgi:hypothetical protein